VRNIIFQEILVVTEIVTLEKKSVSKG